MNQPSLRAAAAAIALSLAPLAAQLAPPIDRRPPPPPRFAQPPSVQTSNVRVTATIEDGVATTRIEQRLENRGDQPGEADWILPLPPGAVADDFTMTIGGKTVDGEVLAADKARAIYEEIVRRRRDPGLLEYYGQGCLRARVFPVPPHGSVDVVVRYRHIAAATGGLHEWRFPLRAVTGLAGASLALDVRIESKRAIKSVWSPLSAVHVARDGDHRARASLEVGAGSIPERDLELFWGVRDGAIGLDLLTYKKGRTLYGWFLMLLSPQQEWPARDETARRVQFVIDTSGSMQGQKIEQAKNALRFFVRSLRPRDSFDVVPFSTEARPFFGRTVQADAEHVAQALQRIDEIQAAGGTNIEDALRAALTAGAAAGEAQVSITVFVTDGQPTIGTTNQDELSKQVAAWNQRGQRIFVFGVGNDVNTVLLDRVASDSRGDRDYVREGEDIEVKTGALFEKLSSPVMTDLALSIDGVEIQDKAPKDLPDLFKGTRLVVLGRYRGTGAHAIRLRGKLAGVDKELVFEGTLPDADTSRDFVPALWAERRIAVLLDAIRMHGQSAELVDEVRRLGREFGIVTPFTSHLVIEEGMRVARARGVEFQDGRQRLLGDGDDVRIVEELRRAGAPEDGSPLRDRLDEAERSAEDSKQELGGLADAPAAGGAAVARSVRLGKLAAKDSYDGGDRGATGVVARRIGARTFHLANGVWVDQGYSEAHRGHERRIEAFSDDYFALLRAEPELAACFAFSARIVVVLRDGSAVEIDG